MALSNTAKCIIGILCLLLVIVLIILLCYFLIFHKFNDITLRVIPETEDRIISYRFGLRNETERYVQKIHNFLKAYNAREHSENNANCDFDRPPRHGQYCNVDLIKHFSAECSELKSYGYISPSPCIFLALKSPKGWMPITYNTPESLPETLPEELEKLISVEAHRDVVWVTCRGVDYADRKNLGGIKYYPMQGFPAYYFKASDVEGYLSPLVALRFENLERNVTIHIECNAWAENINSAYMDFYLNLN